MEFFGNVKQSERIADTWEVFAGLKPEDHGQKVLDLEPSYAGAMYPASWEEFWEGFTVPGYLETHEGTYCTQDDAEIYNGSYWSYWASKNWWIPFTVVFAYCLMLYYLPKLMENRDRFKMKAYKSLWNFSLSAFSFWGAYHTGYGLLWGEYNGILTQGLYASVCTHSSSFGCGTVGQAVGLFCFSKCIETVDTFWLLISKRPPIFLHWYHHISVLLYCWYAYSTRTGNGIYFAFVNYCIHSVMYLYYAMTQCSDFTRKLVKPFAMYITIAQISQMAFGMIIVGLTVYYKSNREVCYTNTNTNMFALVMYFSYFVLFSKMFLERYLMKKQKRS